MCLDAIDCTLMWVSYALTGGAVLFIMALCLWYGLREPTND